MNSIQTSNPSGHLQQLHDVKQIPSFDTIYSISLNATYKTDGDKFIIAIFRVFKIVTVKGVDCL